MTSEAFGLQAALQVFGVLPMWHINWQKVG
jgi:hypothetical protein